MKSSMLFVFITIFSLKGIAQVGPVFLVQTANQPALESSIKIGGHIYDQLSKAPLIAVKIQHPESGIHTVSELNGAFELDIPNQFPCILNIQ